MGLKYTLNFLLLFAIIKSEAQSNRLGNSVMSKNESSIAKGASLIPLKKTIKSAINLTGIWRGYFIQKDFNPLRGVFVEEKYNYEIQINVLKSNAVEGVTYSYRSTAFYGKAAMQGIFTKKTTSLVIKELRMLELKIADMSDPCLMTCFLDYSKANGKEILSGDFTSVNLKTKKDCGDGTVYLEKVKESNFEKEPFLLKKKPNNNLPQKNNSSANTPNTRPLTAFPEINNTTKSKFKPGAEDALITSNTKEKEIQEPKKAEEPKIDKINKNLVATSPLPKVLTERNNVLVKKFPVSEGEILIELYDNGEIDNDTISIYHNGEPVLLNQRLSNTPLKVSIKVDPQHPNHELILVAENLGRIPPNSSLMTVTAGKKTYEVSLTSDLGKSAKVIFEYDGKVGK
jgi:hypothetical protein